MWLRVCSACGGGGIREGAGGAGDTGEAAVCSPALPAHAIPPRARSPVAAVVPASVEERVNSRRSPLTCPTGEAHRMVGFYKSWR